MIASSSINTQYFGKTCYLKSMELQAKAENCVLGFEYDPVITLGKRAGLDEIKNFEGFKVFETDRGGFATLHSPGQLVIYPVINIKKRNLSVRDYVGTLEVSTASYLQGLGIESFKGDESGVFTQKGKIAFIGIRVQNGITQHGISINLKNDLNLFTSIRPCGVSTRSLDSVQNHGIEVDLATAFQEWSQIFQAHL